MWLPMIQSNLKVRPFCHFWSKWTTITNITTVDIIKGKILSSSLVSFVSIYLQGCSCVSRPSRTGWTTRVCRVRPPEPLRLPCANGYNAPSSKWPRWRSSHLRLHHSSTPCDLLCGHLGITWDLRPACICSDQTNGLWCCVGFILQPF